MDVEVQPNLEFIDEPVYIHEITEELHDFHIESESEEEKENDEGYAWCVMSIDIGPIIAAYQQYQKLFTSIGQSPHDYEKRKKCTDKITRMKITDEKLLEQLGFYHRTHDIADSICIMLYWIHKKHEEYIHEQRRKRIMERQIHLAKHGQKLSTDEWFEMHPR
jgi:hypothetical protein